MRSSCEGYINVDKIQKKGDKQRYMDVKDFLNILHVTEKLKDTTRHCTTSKGRVESVAEHSWRISLMAYLLKDEFKGMDMNRVICMCLIHDLGECFTGDIPTFLKTDQDRKIEDALFKKWIQTLPSDVSHSMQELLKEMQEQKTMESKVCKALDKLEAIIQHNESPISTWEAYEYELNQIYAFDVVAFSDWFVNLRKEILKETLHKIETEKN